MNTKYISSSAVKNISIFHECLARVKMLIFSPHEMKYIWYLQKKKVNFLFILYSTEIQKSKLNFLLGRFSFDLTFAVCLLGITLGVNIGCKHSLHLENGLESYFNKWNARNQHLKKVYWVYLREGVTCKLALHQIKQWRHYVWCWSHNMRSVIFDK